MEFADLKTHERDVEYLKLFFKIMISSYDDGACFFATDLDKVTNKLVNRADKFDIPDIAQGQRFSADSLAARAVQAQKTIVVHFPPMVYGIRVMGLAKRNCQRFRAGIDGGIFRRRANLNGNQRCQQQSTAAE